MQNWNFHRHKSILCMLYYHHTRTFPLHIKKTKQNPHIQISWGICPEILISRKGDGEQEQSVPCRHEHPLSKECCWLPPWPFSQEGGTICFYKAHLLPVVPDCSDAQCGADCEKIWSPQITALSYFSLQNLTISTEGHLNFLFCCDISNQVYLAKLLPFEIQPSTMVLSISKANHSKPRLEVLKF